MFLASVIVLAAAAILFFIFARTVQRIWGDPARASLKLYETASHFSGEKHEVLFTPYQPTVFMHDPVRENYSLVINRDGFGLRVSFPTSLYSRHRPLFFPWENIDSIERIFLTNLLVRVEGRNEPFYLYAGVKPARRMIEEWERCRD